MAPTIENDIVIQESFSGTDDLIPVVDYSKLVSHHPNQRSEAVRELGNACLDYDFFAVVNHGVPEELIKGVVNGFFAFFDLSEKEKKIYDTNDAADAIRLGIVDSNEVSRQFITCSSHPTFHCPNQVPNLPELMKEYCTRAREVAMELLRGISEALGLGKSFIEKAMKLDEGYDRCTANDYPSRMKSEKPIGQFAHTDPALIIFLLQNVSGGLEMEHRGSWVNANTPPNSFIVNIADQLEMLTNGKYKSKVHRVIVNNVVRRLTLPLFVGPALDVVVKPMPEFVDQLHPPAYRPMTYRECLEANDVHIIDGKSSLDQIRL